MSLKPDPIEKVAIRLVLILLAFILAAGAVLTAVVGIYKIGSDPVNNWW